MAKNLSQSEIKAGLTEMLTRFFVVKIRLCGLSGDIFIFGLQYIIMILAGDAAGGDFFRQKQRATK
jgi:hypothetical protein